MIRRIEQWIDQTNLNYKDKRVSCAKFVDDFNGFYYLEFLQEAYFVIVDTIPKPDLHGLDKMGLSDFLNMEVDGITYKNTYYILPHLASNLRLHFHELVHVAQWKYLGAIPFIERYINEIQTFGYEGSSLERMAYGFDLRFHNGEDGVDIPSFVRDEYSF